MSLTLVTAPEQEPVTLEDAKAQLRLDFDTDDALVRRLIIAARMWVEGQTKKALIEQTWDQTVDWGWPLRWGGTPFIAFEKNPVTSVTSITYDSGASPRPTLAADQYMVISRQHGSYITPSYGAQWPTPRNIPEAIRIRFVAGYTDVPEPLKHAIHMLVAHWYENREVLSNMSEIPYGVESLISPHRG